MPLLQDSRCLLPSNELCAALDLESLNSKHMSKRMNAICYSVDGSKQKIKADVLLERLRTRTKGNCLRQHTDYNTFSAELGALQAMLQSKCIGKAFAMKPMSLSNGWLGLWYDDFVGFEFDNKFYIVYPPNSYSLNQMLGNARYPKNLYKFNALGNDLILKPDHIPLLLRNITDTLKQLNNIEHVHFQVSLDSIYYSTELKVFYLGHWEQLRHKLTARSLFYNEPIISKKNDPDNNEQTNVFRKAHFSRSKNIDIADVQCIYNSRLQFNIIETFMNPYIDCMMKYKNNDALTSDITASCVKKHMNPIVKPYIKLGSRSNTFFEIITKGFSGSDILDNLSSCLLSSIDLYSFMISFIVIQEEKGLKLSKEFHELIMRTVSPFSSEPFISFEEAYENINKFLKTARTSDFIFIEKPKQDTLIQVSLSGGEFTPKPARALILVPKSTPKSKSTSKSLLESNMHTNSSSNSRSDFAKCNSDNIIKKYPTAKFTGNLLYNEFIRCHGDSIVYSPTIKSGSNALIKTFTKIYPRGSPSVYVWKFQINDKADEIMADNVNGYIITKLAKLFNISSTFMKYIDSFKAPFKDPNDLNSYAMTNIAEAVLNPESLSFKNFNDIHYKKFICDFSKMGYEAEFQHNDLHAGNVLYNGTQFVVIDYGRCTFSTVGLNNIKLSDNNGEIKTLMDEFMDRINIECIKDSKHFTNREINLSDYSIYQNWVTSSMNLTFQNMYTSTNFAVTEYSVHSQYKFLIDLATNSMAMIYKMYVKNFKMPENLNSILKFEDYKNVFIHKNFEIKDLGAWTCLLPGLIVFYEYIRFLSTKNYKMMILSTDANFIGGNYVNLESAGFLYNLSYIIIPKHYTNEFMSHLMRYGVIYKVISMLNQFANECNISYQIPYNASAVNKVQVFGGQNNTSTSMSTSKSHLSVRAKAKLIYANTHGPARRGQC